MVRRKVLGVALACGVGAVLLGLPAASNACEFLDRLFGCGRSTYAPVCAPVSAAPACAPCTQTCNYVPQTYYRTYFRPVPVVAYRPVASCDPCGYQPSRAWTYQSCLVPYSTYRAVYSNPCVTTCAPCVSACSPYGVGGCGVSSGCSTCVTSSSAPLSPTPSAADMSAPALSTPAVVAPAANAPAVSAPAVSAPAGVAPTTVTPPPGPTYQGGVPGPAPAATEPTRAVPAPTTNAPVGPGAQRSSVPSVPAADRGFRTNIIVPSQPPEPANRTTARPVYQAAHYQLISSPKPVAASAYNPQGLDDSGWRASRN